MQPLFSCQQEVGNNVMCRPVLMFDHFRTSPVSERCRRAFRGYSSRAEASLNCDSDRPPIAIKTRKKYIQNMVLHNEQ